MTAEPNGSVYPDMWLACVIAATIHGRPMDRFAFYEAERRIGKGASMAQVRAILGQPDDTRTAADSSLCVNDPDEVVWCYGTSGHLTMPTLGMIRFQNGVTSGSYKDMPPPPSARMFPQEELDRIYEAMYRPPTRVPAFSEMQRLIQAVNTLRPLGKDRALSAISGYIAASEDSGDWLFWVARVLFMPIRADGYRSLPGIGAILPGPPKDATRIPDYPILLIDDLPVNVMQGVVLGGFPEPFSSYVKRCRSNWKMRAAALRPPDDPFRAIVKITRATGWTPYVPYSNSQPTPVTAEDVREKFRTQVVALCGTAAVFVGDRYLASSREFDEMHRRFLAAGGHWDAAKQTYVRRDGSAIAPSPKSWPLQSKLVDVPNAGKLEVTWERSSPDSVDVDLLPVPRNAALPKSFDLVARDVATGHSVAEIDCKSSTWTSSSSSEPTGRSLTIELKVGDKKLLLGPYTP